MKVRWTTVIAAMALFLASGALAQRGAPAAMNEPRVALVIGNAAYKEAPLRNPVNDATDVAQALRELGFAVTLRTNATHKEMEQAIQQFGLTIRRGGVGLFYFSGHGVQSRGSNYFIPIGANIQSEADLKFQSVDAGWVLAQMEDARNRVNIVILDSCRNNPYTRAFRSAARGLAQVDAAKGSFLAFATAPGDVAADGTGRNSPYTKHLLASLRHAESDIFQVFSRVSQAVAQETREQQIPWFNSSLTGRFQFRLDVQVTVTVPPAVAAPDPVANERAFWDSVKDSKNPEELKAYLEQFPDGLFAALARARLKSIESTQLATVAPTTQKVAPIALQDDLQRLAAGTVFKDCDVCPEMVVLPAGKFQMGDVEGIGDGYAKASVPVREVTFRAPFALGKYEITHEEFDRFSQATGRSLLSDHGWGRGRRPVTKVSWDDAVAYVQWLSEQTGKRYRIPSEAEWEYAARAGTRTAFWWGSQPSHEYANYGKGMPGWFPSGVVSGRDQWLYTAPVGQFPANPFGLHDMQGNVWEWVSDCFAESYAGAPSDGTPRGGDCENRIMRGGSWGYNPNYMRASTRVKVIWGVLSFLYYGIRVARDLD